MRHGRRGDATSERDEMKRQRETPAEALARVHRIPLAEARKRMAASMAAAQSMRCPVCGETGAHRCDPKEM